jgi:hypothetical protein
MSKYMTLWTYIIKRPDGIHVRSEPIDMKLEVGDDAKITGIEGVIRAKGHFYKYLIQEDEIKDEK